MASPGSKNQHRRPPSNVRDSSGGKKRELCLSLPLFFYFHLQCRLSSELVPPEAILHLQPRLSSPSAQCSQGRNSPTKICLKHVPRKSRAFWPKGGTELPIFLISKFQLWVKLAPGILASSRSKGQNRRPPNEHCCLSARPRWLQCCCPCEPRRGGGQCQPPLEPEGRAPPSFIAPWVSVRRPQSSSATSFQVPKKNTRAHFPPLLNFRLTSQTPATRFFGG